MSCSPNTLSPLCQQPAPICVQNVLGNAVIGIRHVQVSTSEKKKEKDSAQKLRMEKEAIKTNSHVLVGARIYLRLC